MAKFCRKCGTENESDSKFCSGCGIQLHAQSVPDPGTANGKAGDQTPLHLFPRKLLWPVVIVALLGVGGLAWKFLAGTPSNTAQIQSGANRQLSASKDNEQASPSIFSKIGDLVSGGNEFLCGIRVSHEDFTARNMGFRQPPPSSFPDDARLVRGGDGNWTILALGGSAEATKKTLGSHIGSKYSVSDCKPYDASTANVAIDTTKPLSAYKPVTPVQLVSLYHAITNKPVPYEVLIPRLFPQSTQARSNNVFERQAAFEQDKQPLDAAIAEARTARHIVYETTGTIYHYDLNKKRFGLNGVPWFTDQRIFFNQARSYPLAFNAPNKFTQYAPTSSEEAQSLEALISSGELGSARLSTDRQSGHGETNTEGAPITFRIFAYAAKTSDDIGNGQKHMMVVAKVVAVQAWKIGKQEADDKLLFTIQ